VSILVHLSIFVPPSDLAERLQNATIVAGNFKWNMTDGFKDAIRAKAGR
jgi:hypothetical protein